MRITLNSNKQWEEGRFLHPFFQSVASAKSCSSLLNDIGVTTEEGFFFVPLDFYCGRFPAFRSNLIFSLAHPLA